MRDVEDHELAKVLEVHLRRVRLWASTLLLVVGAVGGGAAWGSHKLTDGVRNDVAGLRQTMNERQRIDSLRFERVMDITELAVVAIVEPVGSPERKVAVEQLRARRHIVN